MRPRALSAVGRPRLGDEILLFPIREGDRLHHLPKYTVGKEHGGHAVFIGLVEGEEHKVAYLLHGARSEHKEAEIAVSGAVSGLEIVRLRRLYAAKAGAAALHVDYKGGQIRAR